MTGTIYLIGYVVSLPFVFRSASSLLLEDLEDEDYIENGDLAYVGLMTIVATLMWPIVICVVLVSFFWRHWLSRVHMSLLLPRDLRKKYRPKQ